MSLFSFWKKPHPYQEFWQWFAANRHRYHGLVDDPDCARLVREAEKRLKRVDSRLFCEFKTNQNPAEFIISADGDKSVFPQVEALVASAPALADWKIVPFRQRGDSKASITIDNIPIGPAQIWFRLQPDGTKVGIFLYYDGILLSDEVTEATILLLDNALGEYDMETKVGFVRRSQLQPEADVRQLKSFDQLPMAFDDFYAAIRGI